MRAHSRRRAQTMTEYMLVISVIVLALTAVVYNGMFPVLEQGSSDFRKNQEKVAKDGFVGTSSKGTERR